MMFISVTAPVVQPICQATRSRINAAGSEGTSRPERGDSMLDQSGCLCAETERVLYPKGPFGQLKRYTWIYMDFWIYMDVSHFWIYMGFLFNSNFSLGPCRSISSNVHH